MWKGKQVGRRRSIVRRMSSWFPVILPPKIYIKVNVIKNSSDKLEKSSCLNSSLSKLHDGLNIITTLLDKTADNYVYWRTDASVISMKSTNSDEKKSLLQSEVSNVAFIVPEPRSSTPISFLQNANVMSNQSALIRISQLEDDLATLRQQIASIVVSQESSLCKTSSVTKTMPSTSSLPSLPPPPPPPPPPLIPSSSLYPLPLPPSQFHLKSQLSKMKLNEKKKSKNKPVNGSRYDDKPVPDMSEILRGINSVKLRHVERSPGGTPIRKPPLPSDPSDPAALLAAALKRRFSRIHPQELSPEKENHELSESLAESSFITNTNKSKNKPFGPYMLKPVKKRETKLFSPLTEMNE